MNFMVNGTILLHRGIDRVKDLHTLKGSIMTSSGVMRSTCSACKKLFRFIEEDAF